MKKKIIIYALLLLLSMSFANTQNISIKIQLFPIGYKNSSFTIYDNEDKSFSDFLFQNIKKSSVAHFYTPVKDRCEEGFYKITVNADGIIYEYEVFAKNIIYDAKNKKYLKYDALSDIYTYLAKKQLECIINKEN
ncbi:hypothetical protein [Treponema sp.]|uniref:hypothetical protein n=1 Tax=Treponema sp. TaxID=166 RepID=UPI003EFDEB10